MSSIESGLLAFVCLLGGALLGMRLRKALPEHHLSDDSRHLLGLGLGVIGTMAGLVLGLWSVPRQPPTMHSALSYWT